MAEVQLEGGEGGKAVQLTLPGVRTSCSTEITGRLRAFTVPLASTERFVCEIRELNIPRVLRFSLRPYLNQCWF